MFENLLSYLKIKIEMLQDELKNEKNKENIELKDWYEREIFIYTEIKRLIEEDVFG